MAVTLTPEWGPYDGMNDARMNLCRLVDTVCDPGVGVAWASADNLYPLRAPRRDGLGFGDALVFHWPDAPPPPPKRPVAVWDRVRAAILNAMAAEGNAELASAQAQAAAGQAMAGALTKIFSRHADDGAGVVFDVVCVGMSLALFASGVGVLGGIALLGGLILLSADGTVYGFELAGDDEAAERVRKNTEVVRIIATVATLPDLGWGGVKAIRELREIRELRAIAQATAKTADTFAARASNASRADQYKAIAARAHLRSQIRSEQIRGMVLHELTPRGAGVGSLGLLFKEELGSDESVLHRFLSRLQIHCTAVHT